MPKSNVSDKSKLARFETLSKGHPSSHLPDADEYIVKCFNSIRRVRPGFSGAVPLTWCEIESFSRQSGNNLTGWESEQVFIMSEAYCSMSHKASEPGCMAPYRVDVITDEDSIQQMRDMVNKQLDKLFG